MSMSCVIISYPHLKCLLSRPSLSADGDEQHGSSQRPHHGKNGRNPPPPVGDHERQPLATRAPVPRPYHHDNHGTPGYLPGFSQQSEPRVYRVPSLQRHWAVTTAWHWQRLKTKHFTESWCSAANCKLKGKRLETLVFVKGCIHNWEASKISVCKYRCNFFYLNFLQMLFETTYQ